MRTLWISLLAASMLLTLVPTAPAKITSVRVPYEGAAPFGHSTLEADCDPQLLQSMGVVCLALPRGTSTLTFSVNDASRLAIGGSYYVYDQDGAFHTAGVHCGETTTGAPNGGTVIVRLDAIAGPLSCQSMGKSPGVATRGYISFLVRN